jgi:hypothetical protein
VAADSHQHFYRSKQAQASRSNNSAQFVLNIQKNFIFGAPKKINDATSPRYHLPFAVPRRPPHKGGMPARYRSYFPNKNERRKWKAWRQTLRYSLRGNWLQAGIGAGGIVA